MTEEKRYYCPKCNNSGIIEYENSFDCPTCFEEFDKKDFNSIKDKSSILSVREKIEISKLLREKKNLE